MGWFDEQIKSRIKSDRQSFEDSFVDLSSVILGKKYSSDEINNERLQTQNAIEEILKSFKAKIIELPQEIEGFNDRLEYMLRPTGIMYRTVNLSGKWWKDAIGPMIGWTIDGDVVALMPYGVGHYRYFDYKTGKKVSVNSKTVQNISNEAICFYSPLPLKPLKIKDLVWYSFRVFSRADILYLMFILALASGIGLLLPMVNNILYKEVAPLKLMGMNLLAPAITYLVGIQVSQYLIGISRGLIQTRLQTKLTLSVSSAAMGRLMSLPATFFKEYSSGELANRTFSLNILCSSITNVIFNTGLTSVFSLVYIGSMVKYGAQLVIPGLIIVLIQVVFSTAYVFIRMNIKRRTNDVNNKLQGLVFSLLNGIQKIKLSGAEKRAFSKWSGLYKESAQIQYDPPLIVKIWPMFTQAVSMLGTLVLYFFAINSHIEAANYISFNTAYAQISGAIMALAEVAQTIADVRPTLELVDPLLKAQPEIDENKKIVTRLSGSIEINNISFRYNENSSLILDDISLKIKPGEYLAIVGKTGCGKSTLMRILLGFEKPEKGAVYYDGKDINTLDLKSLRQRIGTVMQNGKVFSGDIFSNIVICAPWLNLDAAWEAAKMAGFDKDIEDMPMGMNTLISENGGGISGGQKQRLMIARAIAPKPNILMFDEATSALDNVTQKQVSDSLNGLKSTRIVIAHRLSTIKQCDRIIVLDKGKIIEDGTYQELIDKNGFFAELVARQRVDENS